MPFFSQIHRICQFFQTEYDRQGSGIWKFAHLGHEVGVGEDTKGREDSIAKLWDGAEPPSENPYIGQTLPQLELCEERGEDGTVFAEQNFKQAGRPPLLLGHCGRATSGCTP